MLVSSTRAHPMRLSVAMMWSLMLAVVGQTEFDGEHPSQQSGHDLVHLIDHNLCAVTPLHYAFSLRI